MEPKDGRTEQGHVKHGDSLRAKAVAGAPVAGGGVVVEVREKKGPLRAAIPTMPFPLAVICLFLNTFIPGLGKSSTTLGSLCMIFVQIKWKRAELNDCNWRSTKSLRTTQVCRVYSLGVGKDKDTPRSQKTIRCWEALAGKFTRNDDKTAGGIKQCF